MELQDRISLWLKKYLKDNELKSIVIGSSGGIDSAVTSTLCAMTGYKTISEGYLDGFNFFVLSDVTGYSPNFLDTIMEMHLIQNKRNTYYFYT